MFQLNCLLILFFRLLFVIQVFELNVETINLKSKYLFDLTMSLNDDQTYWSWQIRAWINLCSVLIYISNPLSD